MNFQVWKPLKTRSTHILKVASPGENIKQIDRAEASASSKTSWWLTKSRKKTSASMRQLVHHHIFCILLHLSFGFMHKVCDVNMNDYMNEQGWNDSFLTCLAFGWNPPGHSRLKPTWQVKNKTKENKKN